MLSRFEKDCLPVLCVSLLSIRESLCIYIYIIFFKFFLLQIQETLSHYNIILQHVTCPVQFVLGTQMRPQIMWFVVEVLHLEGLHTQISRDKNISDLEVGLGQ